MHPSIDFLQKWNPEGPWVLTAIEVNRRGIYTRSFMPDQLPALEGWLNQYIGTMNIYFQVNRPTRPLDKKAERQDIASLDWLHVDIDPEEGKDIDEERTRALSLLRNPPKGVPAPSVIVFSGGGYQGFWKLQDPVEINGDLGRAEDAKRYNMQLEVLFGADHCHNIDRIMRLPGTINIPDAKKKKKGRTETEAQLIEFSNKEYPLSQFTPAPIVQMAEEGFSTGSTVQISGNIKRLDSVDELDEWGVPDRTKVIIVQGTHPDEGPKAGDNSRSSWLFDALCGMARNDVPDDVMFSVITDPDFSISASVIDKGSNAEKYAIRQIERAKEEAIDPHLRRLNEKHAVVSNMGGKCRVVEEVYDHAMSRSRLTRQSFEDLRNRYMNKQVLLGNDDKGNPKFMPLGKWWLQHPNRRQYDSIGFLPGKEVPGMYNLWKGFACEAKPGEAHEDFLHHIKDNICSGNEEHYAYLIGWMANSVQNPDSPGHTAVVLRGRQGTGKSFFVKQFGSLFGRHFLQVADPKHLVGSFNSHLRDCVVLFGDEAFYAGDKKHESVLKMLITEELITIEAKGVDAEAAQNCTHVLLASNNTWVVPAGEDERRYFVLDVADSQMQRSAYFKAIAKSLENGGRENLLHYLMNYPLEDYDVRKVPKTDALREQKLYSLSPEQEWWYVKLQEGRLLGSDEDWTGEVKKPDLLDDYIEYMKQVGIMRRANATTLGKFLQKVCPEGWPRTYQRRVQEEAVDDRGYSRVVVSRPYFYEFPDLQLCRAHWDEQYQTGEPWPDIVKTMAGSELGDDDTPF